MSASSWRGGGGGGVLLDCLSFGSPPDEIELSMGSLQDPSFIKAYSRKGAAPPGSNRQQVLRAIREPSERSVMSLHAVGMVPQHHLLRHFFMKEYHKSLQAYEQGRNQPRHRSGIEPLTASSECSLHLMGNSTSDGSCAQTIINFCYVCASIPHAIHSSFSWHWGLSRAGLKLDPENAELLLASIACFGCSWHCDT